MSSHQFGGRWTDEKLDRLRRYLVEYTKIFKANSRAAFLRTTFVDAFAGTGTYTSAKEVDAESPGLFEELYDEEAKAFQKGSAQIAIEVEPSFDHYLFIDKKRTHVEELGELRNQFPDKADQIRILHGDANVVLKDWCQQTNWKTNRAVVFLDPYGMAVEWSTIETMARTQAIDLWLLFPLGQAVNRLLTKNGPPSGAWADRLTRIFGTDEWKTRFYRPRQPSSQMSMFDTETTPVDSQSTLEKGTNFAGISEYFVERLNTVFAAVAPNPLPLRNSKNVPIYLLCFAAANPKGAPTAVRIARYILEK